MFVFCSMKKEEYFSSSFEMSECIVLFLFNKYEHSSGCLRLDLNTKKNEFTRKVKKIKPPNMRVI